MSKDVQPNESGLFDKATRLEELPAMGDPLARLDEVIDWTLFDPVFERLPRGEPKGLGGAARVCSRDDVQGARHPKPLPTQ